MLIAQMKKGVSAMNFRWNLQAYKNSLPEKIYTELRAHENRVQTMSLVNGELTVNRRTSESGVSARAFDKGAWSFSSQPEITKASVEKVVKQAVDNAQFLASRKNNSGSLQGSEVAINLSYGLNQPATELSSEVQKELLLKIENLLLTKYPKVTGRNLMLHQQDFIKEIYGTHGAFGYSHYTRSSLFLRLSMDSPNGPVQTRRVLGGKGAFLATIPSFADIEAAVEATVKELIGKAEGVHAEAGIKTVVLGPKVSGILAHEAIGHTVEADIVLGGSIAGSYLNTLVANEKVNMTDFAHTAFGRELDMPVYFDDEGSVAVDTPLIQNGILTGFMHSTETANHFKAKATGHSRAWAFNDEPLIRMRNTAVLPGSDKLADMISSIDDGYYFLDSGNGQADSTSEFMFAVTSGYEIKKGKIGRALLETTISGVAFDMLKSVSMISDEMEWVSYGTCGKKQSMVTAMGGPSLKCQVKIGGK